MSATSFISGGSIKTLTHEMLSSLFIGNQSISLLPYLSTGVTWPGLDFEGADQIFTVKDSLKISQSDSTTTEVKIDQNNETVDTDETPGAWNITGNLPLGAIEPLLAFYNGGAYIGNLAVVSEQASSGATKIRVRKGSGLSGACSLTDGTNTYTVTAVSTVPSTYDELTVSATSSEVASGTVLYKSADLIIGQDGTKYAGRAFFMTSKTILATGLIESKSKAIAFAKLKITAGINLDSAGNPLSMSLKMTILANDESTHRQGDWSFVKKVA